MAYTIHDTSPGTPVQLAGFQESGYVSWVATLLPLRGRDFALSLAGEQKHHAATLVGVRVSCQGHDDVTWYFDKTTHLLMKTEERGTAGTGAKGKVETIRSQFKDVQGRRMPYSWEVYYNGQCLWSHHVIEYQLAEQPAPGMFAKP